MTDKYIFFGGDSMNKAIIGFVGGLVLGAGLTILYLHRDLIAAAINGEELPEAPEGCPFSKAEATEDVQL